MHACPPLAGTDNQNQMSKLLIILLLLLLAILTIYIKSNSIIPINKILPTPTFTPSPTLSAQSTLAFSPEIIYSNRGQAKEAGIQINSQGLYPTILQLELAYDPAILTNVSLSPGPNFPNPNILLNNNDEKTGRISYAFSLIPQEKPLNFTGTAATLKFTVSNTALQKETSLYFLPKTAIISEGVNIPLKIAYGIKIIINQSTPVASTSSTLR